MINHNFDFKLLLRRFKISSSHEVSVVGHGDICKLNKSAN